MEPQPKWLLTARPTRFHINYNNTMIRSAKKSVFRILSIAALILLGVSFAGCKPEGLVDESAFTLYYPGITDIGPSTNFNITPSWHGAAPYDFSISRVTLEGKTFDTDCFKVDKESGVVSLQNTEKLPIGLYAISISCKSSGETFVFDNAIEINMMKPVPDGIKVEPNPLTVKLSDIVAPAEGSVLPTAAITTEGTHISIKKYIISSVLRDGVPVDNFDKLFAVSGKGAVSIIGNNPDFVAGTYSLSFKLTTFIVGEDSEEGLFADAMTIDVTSAPLGLSYNPAQGRVEAAYAFRSPKPQFSGSLSGLKYTLKSVVPQSVHVSIDEKTGELIIPEGNTLTPGDVMTVSVTATNAYGTKDFDDVYTIETVAYVKPVANFAYGAPGEFYQDVAFKVDAPTVEGDYVTYSFAEELPEALAKLSIDSNTGVISAPKSNAIPLGDYTVKVKAENIKNNMIADCKFKIVKNPYYFSYVRYGNNLGLAPISSYANQFRLQESDASLTIPVAETDIPAGQPVLWDVKKTWCKANVTINPETGELTVKASTARMTDYVTVVVTVGGESDAAVTMKIPVFFHFNIKKNGFKIEYTPFVFMCNPKKGGASAAPVITGAGYEPAKFAMDYRRAFNYYNINGPESHKNGQPKDKGFLSNLWLAYFSGLGKPANNGSRDPMSNFSGEQTLRLGYVSPADFSVIINPDKFKDDAGYANGVFIGQIIYGLSGGTDPASSFNKKGDFPIIIWFDTEF